MPQPDFLAQFAAEGPAQTAVPDPQNATSNPQPWPTLPLFTTTPAFVENEASSAWTNEPTIGVRWSLAETADLAGYQLFWDQSPTTMQAAEPLLLSAQATGAQIPVDETGEWYVHLQAVGADGSASRTVHAGPFRVDLSPPTVAAPTLTTAWQSEPQPETMSWEPAADAESGTGGYLVYWGADEKGTSDHFTTNTHFTPSERLPAAAAASRYLRVAPQDLAGNVGAWQTVGVWHYDGLAPSGTLAVGSGGEVVYSRNAELALTGQDDHSGLAAMRFSSDGRIWSPWETYQPHRFWQLENRSDPQTVYAQLRDAAGNRSELLVAEVQVMLTVAPPSSASYNLTSSTLGMGGGQKTSDSYTLNGTSGQLAETGSASSSSYGVNSGYWGLNCTAVFAAIPTIEATASNQVKLSWEPVANASSYNIYRSSSPYFVPSTIYANSNSSPWFDDNVIGDGNSYYYLIRAVGSCGESGDSQQKGTFDFNIRSGS